MTALACPLGIRLLSARLDLRDTLATTPRKPAVPLPRHLDARARTRVHAIAVHRRRDDTPIGRVTIWRDARGLRALQLEPQAFADSALGAEAIDALLGALPTRRRAITITGMRHARRTVARAHFSPQSQAIDEAHAALGIARDDADARGLARVREPRRLELLGADAAKRPLWLLPATARAFRAMRRAASEDGIVLDAVSGFRSVGYQVALIRRKLARGQSLAEALTVLAAPGYSEHHSGRALDLGTPGCPPAEEVFETTPAYAWLERHAARFGFRLSYPRGNPHGIAYEPWHWYDAG